MQTKLILLLFTIFVVVSCAPGNVNLPTLGQAKYFNNDTVEWFPEIRGGTPLPIDQMDGVVSIQNRYGYHLCSGVLVSYKLVLTVANCLFNSDGDQLDTSEIRIIADDTIIVGDGSVTRQVQEIEAYNFSVTRQGLVIIELLNPFIATDTLTFSEISNYTVSEDEKCQVIGWGVSSQNSAILLQKVDVQIVSNKVANGSKYFNNKMPNGTIAAATIEGGNSCFGELGSFLKCDDFINGFLSFGFGCSKPDFPNIFYDTYDNDLIVANRARMLNKLGVSKPSISKPVKYPVYKPVYSGGNNGRNSTGATNLIQPTVAIVLCTIVQYNFNRFFDRF